ncbi:MAG: DNA-binding response regulator [Chromatiales bacterium 21-64-14]|nr:MAG: DNA-binding response regulator [Chromatiales bacterium 21-64-14]HQU16887.1 response regulator transcription factor [Gammaproteobacteria bacterium]
MSRVLLIDDDVELCQMLVEYLEPEGFRVDMTHDGEAGARRAREGHYDVVVLDIMLPNVNGLEALQRIRNSGHTPVLMLTAKGDDVDRIVGLELGADDYLAKPCNPRELVARLRAILRRTGLPSVGNGEVTRIGALTLRPAERVAQWRGQTLDLTSTEFNLLAVLVREAGHTVGKAQLSAQAMGRALARYDRSIDMHLSNLRHKLGTLADGRSPIQTVRGMGYQYIVE